MARSFPVWDCSLMCQSVEMLCVPRAIKTNMSLSVFGVCGVWWLRYNGCGAGYPVDDAEWLGYSCQWVCVCVCSVMASAWGTHMYRLLLGCMQLCWSVGGSAGCWGLLIGGPMSGYTWLWLASVSYFYSVHGAVGMQEAYAIFCGSTTVASCWGTWCPPHCCTPWK